MVKLTAELTERKNVVLEVNPLGKPQGVWFLEEQVEKYYSTDMCHDGGFEGESYLIYILCSEKSANDLFSKLVERRKSEGWEVRPGNYTRYSEQTEKDMLYDNENPQEVLTNYIRLTRFVGDSECRINYHLYQKNVIPENFLQT